MSDDCIPVPIAVLKSLSRLYSDELAPLVEKSAQYLEDECGLSGDALDLEEALQACDAPIVAIQDLLRAYERVQAKSKGAA